MQDRPIEDFPDYIIKYAYEREPQSIEIVDDKQYVRLTRSKNVLKVKAIKTSKELAEAGLLRVLVTRKLEPLTVMKNPMLKLAAQLELKVYQETITVEEARYCLIDAYPITNCLPSTSSNSALELIREFRGSLHLDLSEVCALAKERREQRNKLCYV